MLRMAGFLTLHLSVSVTVYMCVCVSVTKISQKNIESIKFIFGGSLPSDPERKPIDFEKNLPGVRVGVGGLKYGPNDKR